MMRMRLAFRVFNYRLTKNSS